jgi:hypothetical protein
VIPQRAVSGCISQRADREVEPAGPKECALSFCRSNTDGGSPGSQQDEGVVEAEAEIAEAGDIARQQDESETDTRSLVYGLVGGLWHDVSGVGHSSA